MLTSLELKHATALTKPRLAVRKYADVRSRMLTYAIALTKLLHVQICIFPSANDSALTVDKHACFALFASRLTCGPDLCRVPSCATRKAETRTAQRGRSYTPALTLLLLHACSCTRCSQGRDPYGTTWQVKSCKSRAATLTYADVCYTGDVLLLCPHSARASVCTATPVVCPRPLPVVGLVSMSFE